MEHRGDPSTVKGIRATDPLAKAAELAQAIVLRYESSERPKKPRVLVMHKKSLRKANWESDA
jgi:hypothetical protein